MNQVVSHEIFGPQLHLARCKHEAVKFTAAASMAVNQIACIECEVDRRVKLRLKEFGIEE